MKERKIYYKVVWPTPVTRSYRSIFTKDPSLIYEVGKYTATVKQLTALGYHPTVFISKKAARHFVHIMGYGAIYECHIWGLIKDPPLRFTSGVSPLRFLQDTEKTLGRPFRTPTSTHGGFEWPPGTVMAKKVKLLRRI